MPVVVCIVFAAIALYFSIKLLPKKKYIPPKSEAEIERERDATIFLRDVMKSIKRQDEGLPPLENDPLLSLGKQNLPGESNLSEPTRKTSEDILNELLNDDTWEVISVDAELIFKRANYKNDYYLHAKYYFPEREDVFGTNANGKIVWVNLYNQKEATHPQTGERIPGIKRYLRQNAVK